MSSGAENRSKYQQITDHIKSLDQRANEIDDQQKHLDKLKVSAEEDVCRQYDSLVNAINKSHKETAKQLDELYRQQKQKLDAARQRLIDIKTKAEMELIVDHKPVEMPEVSLNCTVNIAYALLAIGLLKLSAESGENIVCTLPMQELKTEPGSVGGFSFPSKSSDAGVTPVSASLSTVPPVASPQNIEATRKRKKKGTAAETESTSLPPTPPAPKMAIHNRKLTVPSVVPSQRTKATNKRKMKETAAETGSPSHPPTPKMTIPNLRDFIRCINCRRPRCVYSSKKLTKDDRDCWNGLKGILPYRCGANLFPKQPLIVETTDCSKEVNNHYFRRKFPAVCYNCGNDFSSSSKQVYDINQADMIIHDACQSCKDQGIEPRKRKKKSPSNKANNDESSNSGLLF